jgi:hypothetical protein
MKIMENGIPHRNYSLVRLSYGSGYDFEQPMFNCYEILNKWQKEREPGKNRKALALKPICHSTTTVSRESALELV